MSQQTTTTPEGRGAASPTASSDGARTPEQIEADLVATRERLTHTIDTLVDRVHPNALARRSTEKAKATVLDEDGKPRTERLVTVAVGVGVTVGTLLVLRGLVRRRRN